MKLGKWVGKNKPFMLRIPATEVPHIVIEPNFTCNSHCRICYNREKQTVKPLAAVCAEIDMALAKRRIETVSLLGGEPTLHPEIVDIVRYVKGKKCFCQLLTNGIVFQEAAGALRLRELVTAGVDRVVLHADCGQAHSGQPLDAFIERTATMLESSRVYFALAVTLYEENRASLPALMKRLARFRCFDGILATFPQGAPPSGGGRDPEAESGLREENAAIMRELGVAATVYVPSSRDDREVCWLMYFYYFNTATGMSLGISKALNRLYRRAYRLWHGRQAFAATTALRWMPLAICASLLVEFLLGPWRLPGLVRLSWKSSWMRNIRYHYIVIQAGPVWDLKTGEPHVCRHCPDATIRNGKLTPVCLADAINPLGNSRFPEHPEWRAAVLAHLGETP